MTGRAKGRVLTHLKRFVEERHGRDAWRTTVVRLPTSDRELLSGLVLAGSWVPVGVWNRAVEAFLPEAYRDLDAGMGELAGYIAERDMNKVYRTILAVSTPEFLLQRSRSLWGRYFDDGHLAAQPMAPGHWVADLRVPVGPEAPGYYTCGPGVSAWLTHGLRTVGVEPRVSFRCESPRRGRWSFDIRW